MGMGCIFDSCVDRTLPETNRSSHLKMDALKTILSFWDGLFWQVRYVNFREGISSYFFGGNLHFCLGRSYGKSTISHLMRTLTTEFLQRPNAW